MTRTRIIVVALAALALAAPAASADPHAIDSHNRALLDRQHVVQNQTSRALQQERAYSTYGEPVPIEQPAPLPADDGTPWPLVGAGFAGLAVLFGLAVLLVARPRRPRVAT